MALLNPAYFLNKLFDKNLIRVYIVTMKKQIVLYWNGRGGRFTIEVSFHEPLPAEMVSSLGIEIKTRMQERVSGTRHAGIMNEDIPPTLVELVRKMMLEDALANVFGKTIVTFNTTEVVPCSAQ